MKKGKNGVYEKPHITALKEMVLKFPNTPNLTLAKAFVKKHPNFYLTVEQARKAILTLKGKSGDTHRKHTYVDFRAELDKLKKELPKGETEKIEPYHLPKSIRRVLLLSDIHIPYHNDEALFTALEFGLEKNVDCIYLNGDTMDIYQLSRHEKNPYHRDFKYERDCARVFLKGLRNMFPNALIVYKIGNHCFKKGTEVLTSNGFIDFEKLEQNDFVAQFDKQKNISFSHPKSIIKQHYKGLLYDIENNYSKQIVTDEHRVAIGNDFVLANQLKISDIKDIPLNGFVNNEDYDVSDEMLKFIVWLVCDGCIVYEKKPKSEKIRFQFKLSKERKIDSLRLLLEQIGVPYTFKECKKSGINKLQPYYIRLYKKEFVHSLYKQLNGKKHFPSWFRELSKRQVEVVLNEIAITDGSLHDGGICLTTTSQNDASLLQEIAITNGINCNVKKYENQSGFDNSKTQYKLRIKIDSENTLINVKKIETQEYDDMVYCVEMPLGTVITRYDGKVAFSGNCERYEKWIMMKSPEIFDEQYMSLGSVLGFTELGIIEVKSKQFAYAGKLPILHGHELPMKSGGDNPANLSKKRLGKQAIFGHFHKTTQGNGREFDKGMSYAIYSTGCLCDLHPNYMPINEWNHGFAYIEIDKDGGYVVENKTILNGKIY